MTTTEAPKATIVSESTSSGTTDQSHRRPWGDHRTTSKILTYLILIVGSIAFLMPFVWMITTSLKPKEQVFAYPVEWVPDPFQWSNYAAVFTETPMLRYIINTVILTFLGVLGSLVGSSIAAYAFARLRFPGRDLMFFLMLSTMMIPGWVTLIPSYIMFGKLGWLDTYLPLLVPVFFASPFNTFLLRQFFRSIPAELEDAARIDGAGQLRIFLRITLPLAKPALIMVGLFAFLTHWNDFLGPLIYLQSQEKFPLSLGIMNFVGEQQGDFALMMCAATIAMAPCIFLFFVAQRWFIQGVVITGVKG